MSIVADLQLHSRYSRAVSQKMDLFEISRWSKRKGIHLVATGDWQHPLWFRELQANLEETTPGIYKLKKEDQGIRYLLSSEISSIYSQGGKTRRVHNLIWSPSLTTCEKIIKELQKRGANILSDGRPIVGIPSKDLLKMILDIDENCLMIPAHIWTPWYSLFGSMSGFDSIEECFGEYAKYIYAVETGLSSDPVMNWQIKELDSRSILSFSDAHSGPKLGREATVFVARNKEGELRMSDYGFADIADAIKQHTNSKLKIGYTIEFFPEEGKYHWTGHRACGVKFSGHDAKERKFICPVCNRTLVIGVENRIMDLSYKTIPPDKLTYLQNSAGLTYVYDKEKKRTPFVSLVPLLEILMKLNGHSPTKSLRDYYSMTDTLGTEFDILLRKSYDEIRKYAGMPLESAIRLIRERKIKVDPGFDGVFGKVSIPGYEKEKIEEKKSGPSQSTLF